MDVDDVIDVNERYLAYLFKEVLDIDVKLPIQRITWPEAMDRFGSDKPDMRFGMELHDFFTLFTMNSSSSKNSSNFSASYGIMVY